MLVGVRNGRALIVVGLVCLTSCLGAVPASSQGLNARISDPEKRLYVVGRDAEVPIRASVPAECTASELTFSLYASGGAAKQNSVVYPSVSRRVSATGLLVDTALALDPKVFESPDSVWPGVSGNCLSSPVVYSGASLLIGLRSQTPDRSSFFIPRSSLTMGRDEQVVHATLTLTVDGTKCGAVDLDDSKAKDPLGNLLFAIGGRGEPAACSREGGVLRIFYPNGQALFETREVALGVLQPFANLAPEAGPSTGVPEAPAAGDSPAVRASESTMPWIAVACVLIALAVPIVKVAGNRFRRASRLRLAIPSSDEPSEPRRRGGGSPGGAN